MTEAVYRWADHPSMPPRPASYFITYWSTMAHPLTVKEAWGAFAQLVRSNAMIQVLSEKDRAGAVSNTALSPTI